MKETFDKEKKRVDTDQLRNKKKKPKHITPCALDDINRTMINSIIWLTVSINATRRKRYFNELFFSVFMLYFYIF